MILLILLVVFVALGLVVGTFRPSAPQVACTTDAKLCPDGSAVGRTGPQCQFASCPEVSESKNIRVYQPAPGDIVGQPLTIVGEARVFENAFSYRITDAAGNQLASGFDAAHASDVGKFGAFSVMAQYSYPGSGEGFVEVYTHSAKDGGIVDLVKIPVKFEKQELTAVKVFLANEKAERPSTSDLVVEQCETVFPVYRTVPKTDVPAKAAIAELLKGPSSAELQAGYSTTINSGVSLRLLSIKDGVATADFSSELMREVGGSCRVSMIVTQINATLRQFETVTSVESLVDGKPHAIQP